MLFSSQWSDIRWWWLKIDRPTKLTGNRCNRMSLDQSICMNCQLLKTGWWLCRRPIKSIDLMYSTNHNKQLFIFCQLPPPYDKWGKGKNQLPYTWCEMKGYSNLTLEPSLKKEKRSFDNRIHMADTEFSAISVP